MPKYLRAGQRYVLLVEQLGAELNHKRGWKNEVAAKLGVRPAYVSMLTSGSRKTVGAKAIDLAIERMNLTREFFYGDLSVTPHYRDYIDDIRHTAHAASPGTQWLLSRTVKASPLQAFLSSESGREISAIERQILQSMDFAGLTPSLRTFELIVAALRKTILAADKNT